MDMHKNAKLLFVVIILLLASMLLPEPVRADENTRIYVVFTSSGLQGECRIYPICYSHAFAGDGILPNGQGERLYSSNGMGLF